MSTQQDNSSKGKKKGGKKKFISLDEFQQQKPTGASGQTSPTVSTSRRSSQVSSVSENRFSPIDKPAPANKGTATPSSDHDDDMEGTCFICAEEIQFYAIGECNHRVCHLCSLRLRALYKQKTCAYCKTELAAVVYTKSPSTSFQEYELPGLPAVDQRLSIYFDDTNIYEEVMILLRFNCPEPTCDVACPGGWSELKNHVKKAHGMTMCDLCTRHKKLFTHEHTLYTRQTLARHNEEGDPEDRSFKGHPQCGFCKTRFYGQDELFEHCREHHEQCFLCQRKGIRNQYYRDYNDLEDHFRNDHILCPDKECLEQKFMVFDSEIDFKAHEMEVHRGASQRRGRGEQIQLDFNYAGSPARGFERQDGRGGRRRGGGGRGGESGGGGGGRDRNRRDERADEPPPRPAPVDPPVSNGREPSQRLRPPPGFGTQLSEAPRATASISESTLTRVPSTDRIQPPPSFGAQLTPTPGEAARSANRETASATPPPPSGSPAIGGDPELAQRIQYLFNSDRNKLAEFKSLATSFKNSAITADEFLTAFATLALGGLSGKNKKEAEAEMGRVWNRLADTVPGEPVEDEWSGADGRQGKGKKKKGAAAPSAPVRLSNVRREALLRAWNDWKVKTTEEAPIERPSTPSYANSTAKPSPILPANTASSSSSTSSARVLVIKSKATNQRVQAPGMRGGRAGGRGSVWDQVARGMEEREQRENGAGTVTFAGRAAGDAPSASSLEAFPGLGAAVGSSSTGNSRPTTAPFVPAPQPMRAGVSSSTSAASLFNGPTLSQSNPKPIRPSAATVARSAPSSAGGSRGPKIDAQEFPGLPKRAPRPTLAMLRAQNGRGGSAGSGAGGSAGAWGPGGREEEERWEDDFDGESAGKKKGKKKQVLLYVG
ncbi:hypothetical protein HDV00_002144 [Rhizophlyctis rosea]|nr:hypothetical protein HDV00_002144 [Rhizophlyctis rosea]